MTKTRKCFATTLLSIFVCSVSGFATQTVFLDYSSAHCTYVPGPSINGTWKNVAGCLVTGPAISLPAGQCIGNGVNDYQMDSVANCVPTHYPQPPCQNCCFLEYTLVDSRTIDDACTASSASQDYIITKHCYHTN